MTTNTMNTTNETSKLTSLTTTMAPTTTFSKSTKKGLAVLAALCMLSFYTGHLSRGGEQSSNVSLLRNGVLESGGVTTTNGISDSGGVTTTNGKAELNQRHLADDEASMPLPVQCRARGEDCARFTIDYMNAFCKSLKECKGCLKDSDCVEGSCTKTVADLDRPKSTFTMCVIPENCRPASGLPVDMAYTTCDGADAFQPMGSGSGYNTDCCGDKKCITNPATPLYVQPVVPEYNYCGDVCIKKKNCTPGSAHAREAECGDSDTYACCSGDVRERNWKLGNGDTCGRRTGQGGKPTCNPGTEGAPNCDCAPRAGLCRWMCELERTFCNGAFPFDVDCPRRTCCVGGKCDPFFQDGDVYTE